MSERTQVGGNHYETEDGYEHWDWVVDAEIGYLAGNATKYISRWRKKNGLLDLQKAITYIDKMIATRKNADWHYRESRWKIGMLTDRFIKSAGLTQEEGDIIHLLAGPCPPEMLRLARERVDALIKSAQRAASAANRAGVAVAPPQATPPAQQALRGAPTVADATRQPGGATGMEHPFGYDPHFENGEDT